MIQNLLVPPVLILVVAVIQHAGTALAEADRVDAKVVALKYGDQINFAQPR